MAHWGFSRLSDRPLPPTDRMGDLRERRCVLVIDGTEPWPRDRASVPTQRQEHQMLKREIRQMNPAILVKAAGDSSRGVDPAEPSETTSRVASQPQLQPSMDQDTSDILVQTLIDWGVSHVFGIVGDGIGPLIEALRKRQAEIAYIGVRHEESAAFMAGGFARHSGRLGACVATTGPGAIHLLNGLYDSAFDGAPVIAITGTTFHDLQGMRFFQGVNTIKLMESVALFNEQVTGPAHAILIGNRACRAALGGRGVAHLTVAKDTQAMKLSADKRSMENHGGQTSSSWMPPKGTPPIDQLQAAADLINAGSRVAILAGQECLTARPEVELLAETLGAPVAKAYLAKALMPDDHPLTTGGIGKLGTLPSWWTMHHCDTVLILGSTMPWINYYPTPGQARGVQVDMVPDRIGLKYPVEVGLVGDIKATLDALHPLLDTQVRSHVPSGSPEPDERLAQPDRSGSFHAERAATPTPDRYQGSE